MGQNASNSSDTNPSLGARAQLNNPNKPASSLPSSVTRRGDYSSGEERRVFLNVYEPSKPEHQSQVPGFGIYHSGVELLGAEWSFAGGSSGTGVFQQRPRATPIGTDWKYKSSIDLGALTLSDPQLYSLLREMEKEWPSSSYDLVHRNCNHFSEALCTRLGLSFPSWVNRTANFGKMFIAKSNNSMDPSSSSGALVKEAPKPSVFQTSKGHRLDGGSETDSSSSKSSSGFSLFKKKEEPAPPAVKERKNPWKDPNFKIAQQAKSSTKTPLSDQTTAAAAATSPQAAPAQ